MQIRPGLCRSQASELALPGFLGPVITFSPFHGQTETLSAYFKGRELTSNISFSNGSILMVRRGRDPKLTPKITSLDYYLEVR